MQNEQNGTIEELFSEFGLDCDTMEVGVPYDVHESDIEIEAFDEKLNKKVFAKVKNAIKKPIQSSFRFKLKNREDFESPMAGDHFVAITHHDSGKIDYAFVKDLIIGMNVITIDGEDEIEKIEKLEDDFVYDIETETGNYFTNGILSHNTTISHAICHTGGFALKYAASTTFRTKKIENITKGSIIKGIRILCRNYKNKTGIPFRECEMDLYYEGGFDSTGEYIDFLKEFADEPRLQELITVKAGGNYKSDKFGWSFRGKDALTDAIKSNSLEGWDEIKATIDDIIRNPIEGKENTADPEQEIEQNMTKEMADEFDKQNEE